MTSNNNSTAQIRNQEEDLDNDDSFRTVPDNENEFDKAKTFLQEQSQFSGDNLYDHLTDILNKILAERPENVIDYFEEYSRKVKEKRFKPLTDHLEDIYVSPARYALAKKWQPFLIPLGPDAPSTVDPYDDDKADMTRNDMLLLLFYFEQAGIGLPKTEMFAILLSMMRLVKKEPLASIRFWGKIFGLYKNYIIVEATLTEEQYSKKLEAIERNLIEEEIRMKEKLKQNEEIEEKLIEINKGGETEGEAPIETLKVGRTLPPIPQILFEQAPSPPDEKPGEGLNKLVYYVCNEAGDQWVMLPDVTAKQIRVARIIVKSFSGILETPIYSYPEFPGVEINYLRAQIARISAGTHISPLGFYNFGEEGGEDEEEEEEEEEENKGAASSNIKENMKFEGVPIRDMVDGSMSFWVHHSQYILPQGRTNWWNPSPASDEIGEEEELGEEEENEEGKPKVAGYEPETGPALLTPLSEDSSLEAVAPWSVRSSYKLTPQFSVAIVRSNIWPGAYCFATQGKLFQNVYFGNGLKFIAHNFSPKPLPPVQQDYPIGPEIMEMADPTGAEEEAWRIAHLPKEKTKEEGGEDEQEEEEEENDEDDEDDDEDDD